MARFPIFGRQRHGVQREGQTAARRARRPAALAGAGVVLALAAGMVGAQGAFAGNPMTIGGTVLGNGAVWRTLDSQVNGQPCAGGSATLAPKVTQFTVSLPSSCGSAGQAVTFTENGAPVGLETSNGKTCLQFTPGSTVSSVVIEPGQAQDTSCAGSGSGLKLPVIGPASLPVSGDGASPLVLTPTKTVTSKYADEESMTGGFCGGPVYFDVGLDDVNPQNGEIALGYDHSHNGGPCWSFSDFYNRGGVGFDMQKVNTFVISHGLKHATLQFSVDSGDFACLNQVQVAGDDWSQMPPMPKVLPGSAMTAPAPVLELGKGRYDVDLTDILNLHPGDTNSSLHFVFVGNNEGSDDKTATCLVTLGGFTLTLSAEH